MTRSCHVAKTNVSGSVFFFYRTHTEGIGDESGGGAVLSAARCYRPPPRLSTFLSPPAARDWQPPSASDVSKGTILFSADVRPGVGCRLLHFLYGEGIPRVCAAFASWQVMSGAKRRDLQHTQSSVNQEQKERKTNDTSVTYCGDGHNSPPQSKSWKHARRLFFIFYFFPCFKIKATHPACRTWEIKRRVSGRSESHCNIKIWVLIIRVVFVAGTCTKGSCVLLKWIAYSSHSKLLLSKFRRVCVQLSLFHDNEVIQRATSFTTGNRKTLQFVDTRVKCEKLLITKALFSKFRPFEMIMHEFNGLDHSNKPLSDGA